MPFTLPFDNDGHVIIMEDLLFMKFNLQVGTIYIEQEMYSMDGDIS